MFTDRIKAMLLAGCGILVTLCGTTLLVNAKAARSGDEPAASISTVAAPPTAQFDPIPQR